MKTHFAQVLAHESTQLAAVTDGTKLTQWRNRVVAEVMKPRSAYAIALRHAGEAQDRAAFLDRWRELIAETVGRLSNLQSAEAIASDEPNVADVDPQRTAVLILAALHGGCTLSHVVQDQWPLNAALDMALAPFARLDASPINDTGSVPPDQ
jgi:hypothetical protein